MTNTSCDFKEENRTLVLKSLNDLQDSAAQLYHLIKADSLIEKSMAGQIVFLIENNFTKIAEELGYDFTLINEREELFREIIKANQTIHELEKKLASEKPIDGLSEQLQYLVEKVCDWWRVEGFNHVSNEKFSPYSGLHLEFNFMLESSNRFSSTPEKDKFNEEAHVKKLRDMGFEFADSEKERINQRYLIDNEKNRNLLTDMLRQRFPSLKIFSFENRCSFDSGKFLIHQVIATISDLADI